MSMTGTAEGFRPLLAIPDRGRLVRLDVESEWDEDPRGIVFCAEPPNPRHTYIMGIDPTMGRTGWNRANRVQDDARINLGSIEVIRLGRQIVLPDGSVSRTPDVQVVEYAAPVDPFELAYVANIIGRVYAGEDSDQCQCIIESYPGPGGMTSRQMIELGYVNLWQRQQYGGIQVNTTSQIGWHATQQTIRDLWAKSSRHINLKRVRIWSPWLVEEYADARLDVDLGYAVSASNEKGHGDRMRAFNLALWAGNRWDTEIERTQEEVTTSVKRPEWAHTAMTADEIRDKWTDIIDGFMGW